MSDTGGFPLVGGSPAFPGKNNVIRDGSGSNSFGWENLNVGNLSVVGGYRNKVTKEFSATVGAKNVVGSAYSCAFGENNDISQNYSYAFGASNILTSLYSFAFGSSNAISASYSGAFGVGHSISGSYAFASGTFSTVSGDIATCFGRNGRSSRYGELAHAGYGTLDAGYCQHGWLVFGNQSTSATPAILYLNGIAATQRAVLAAGARWKCTLEIMAATTGAIDKSASWEYKFQIDRPTTAASTIIRTTPLLTLSDGSNAGAPPAGWSVAITADTTNGCPQIQVTGDTDTINWTAALHYVQSIRV